MLKLKALVRLTIPWSRETIEVGQEFDCPEEHVHQLHTGEYAEILSIEHLEKISDLMDSLVEKLSDEDHDLKNLL